jgi:hypothetical protein
MLDKIIMVGLGLGWVGMYSYGIAQLIIAFLRLIA